MHFILIHVNDRKYFLHIWIFKLLILWLIIYIIIYTYYIILIIMYLGQSEQDKFVLNILKNKKMDIF